MSRRSYRLLCPIARALDRVGDRWTLLLLRDLHAGPARFRDLQRALPGLADNLLVSRLRQLEEDGLIVHRESEFDVGVYELTTMGQKTGPLLFELAHLGAQFPAPDAARSPGNLRLLAVTLQVAAQRVAPPSMNLSARLVVDGQDFMLDVVDGEVDVQYRSAPDASVVVEMDYDAMMAVVDGDMTMETFAANHVQIKAGEKADVEALTHLMGGAMSVLMN